MIDRTLIPKFKQLEFDNIMMPKTYKENFGNIIEYIDNELDVCVIKFVFNAGLRNQKNKGIASFTNYLLKKGTKKYNTKQISELIDYYGGSIQFSIKSDYSTIKLLCLTKHIDKYIDLLHNIINDSVFPENEFDKIKKKRIMDFSQSIENTDLKASILFNSHIFKNTIYNQSFSEITEIETINLEQCKDFYNKHYRNKKFDLFIIGNISDETKKQLFEKFSTNREISYNSDFIDNTYNAIIQNIDLESKVQSSIIIGTQTISNNHQDIIKLGISNVILGGYFGSRLMKNIREEKGLTYGIYSMIEYNKDKNIITIVADVNKSYKQEVVNEIFKEIEKLKKEYVRENELQIVKNYIFGNMISRLENIFSLEDFYFKIYKYNLSKDYYKIFNEELKELNKNEIKRIFNTYYNDFSVITVG